MSIRSFHAYLDRPHISVLSQSFFDRLTNPHLREPFAALAGRRIQFISLYVEFDGDVPIRVVHVEPVWITFDDEGRCGEAEAKLAQRAAVALLDEDAVDTESSTVIHAASRFVSTRLQWEPTGQPINLVLDLQGLRRRHGTTLEAIDAYGPSRPAQRHLRLVPMRYARRRSRPPISSAELNASLEKRWSSWVPGPLWDEEYVRTLGDDVDSAVHNLALMAIDTLYDELTARGLMTGENFGVTMFPSTIEGYLPPLSAVHGL